uniref:Transcription termination factor 2 n=1 Tax=Takifugu rubripes TaxID=31033 RepID=A0A674NN30_TAKRU
MSVPVDVCDPVSGITLKAPFVISTTCPVNLLGRDLISQLQLMIRTTAEGMWSVDRMVNLWVREGEMCSKFWSLDIPEKQPPPFSDPITMIYGKALSYLQPEAQLHNQADLHVTMHVERTGEICKSDPHGTSSYAEQFAELKDPQMIVIMHLYVCGQTQRTSQTRVHEKKTSSSRNLLPGVKATLSAVNVAALPDKGERLRTQIRELEEALASLSIGQASQPESQIKTCGSDTSPSNSQVNPFNRPGGTILLPSLPSSGPSQQASSSSLGLQSRHGSSQMSGGRPNRLMAEAIDNLHNSLESCPGAEVESEDPRGLKVKLLPHQKRALAWLLWRETQNPCGGILADEIDLGKTLTMISLILKDKKKGEDKKKEKQLDKWLSKTDSTLVASKATLIICPTYVIHHWKREIDRHVSSSELSVYLYHGPNRERSARALADYDVVVTTYSLVSQEIPVQKEEAPPSSSTLFRVAWERVVLDEAHNIKNPEVHTSVATCQLTAHARWAVTGTPIQNNLLDMYSLLKFLRYSPFDEFKLWKAQVDNGSDTGIKRLHILTRSLLLRRTKDQKDAKGSPLVTLPGLMCKVHRPKLSQDEKKVYDGLSQTGSAASGSQQPQQASSTKDNLSVRLRQCCCHLSLLKETLDPSELNGDEIVVPLEEQLNALSLTSSPSQAGPKDTVTLFGTQFPSELFEKSSESTKISAILSELKKIRENDSHQKSVIVSQWTSMLRIVAVHLESIGLRYGIIDGDVNPEQRMDLVKEFNDNPKGPQVMLVSLRTQDGLNLIGGNHLFLTEMHWNPAIEDQACARIYRVGQTKDVTIHRFVCKDTVEEEISTLQVEKRKLAQNVLSGTGSTSTKLSLADLRKIFGV